MSILFKSMLSSPTACACMPECVCIYLCVGGGRVRGHISHPSTFCIDFSTDISLKDKPLVQQGCPHSLTHYSYLAYTNRCFAETFTHSLKWSSREEKVEQYHTQWYGIKNTLTPVKQFSEGEDVLRVKTGIIAWSPTLGKEGCLRKFTKKTESKEGQQLPKTDNTFSSMPFFLFY